MQVAEYRVNGNDSRGTAIATVHIESRRLWHRNLVSKSELPGASTWFNEKLSEARDSRRPVLLSNSRKSLQELDTLHHGDRHERAASDPPQSASDGGAVWSTFCRSVR